MFFQRIKSKFRSRRNTANATSSSISGGAAIDPFPSTLSARSATPVQQPGGTEKRDLWREAFELLEESSKQKLELRGMSITNSEPMEDQLKALRQEAERQCERCKEREWRVAIGSHEVSVRKTTLQIIEWVKKIGDVAIEFAPCPGHGVWAVARSILEEVDEFDREKVALLSVVDKVTGVLFSAQVYYEIYTTERTGKRDVVHQLCNAIVTLYSCILRVMVKSSDLSSNTAVQFCRAVFDSDRSFDLLQELQEQQQGLTKVAEICEMTANASADVRLQKYLQEAQVSLNEIAYNVEHVFEWVSDQERREILQWVSNVQYGRHYDDIERRRSPDTGDWLLRHGNFIEWLDSPGSSVIWLQGSPGTGKTFLSAAVISHLIKSKGAYLEGFAYFFCNRDEDDRRRALPVLHSLVRQLATPKHRTDRIRKGLQLAHETALDNGSNLGLEECCDQILESLNIFSTTFIVLDALDELDFDEVHILMKKLEKVISETTQRVKLFVASRPEARIESRYKSRPTIKIRAEDNIKDIEKHVDSKLEEFKEDYPDSAVSMMTDHIRDTILCKCDNMFLWADLQLKQIFRCRTSDSVIEMLEDLPRGLENTYNQIHNKIREQASSEQGIAERALKWMVSSPRLLKTDELLPAVCMIIEEGDIKLKSPLNPQTLLSICENLLIVDSNDEWRFFHLSAREYFEKVEGERERARSHCAQICLLYLMRVFDPEAPFEPVELRPSSSFLREKTEQHKVPSNPFDIQHPFFDHAQKLWPFYVRDQSKDDQSVGFLKRFLGSPQQSSIEFRRWHAQIFESPLPVRFIIGAASEYTQLGAKDLEPIEIPMFTVTLLPLYETLREWCEINDFDASAKNRRGRSLLSIAAADGNVGLCKTLISKGAYMNEVIYGQDGSALAAACRNGKFQATKYLVEAGANINLPLQVGRYGSALSTAVVAPGASLQIVKYLVQAGAEVNMILDVGMYGSALATAAHRGHIEIVKYLVDSGADINLLLPEHSFGSALAAATTAPKQALEIVKYLVNTGADVNLLLEGGYHGSALAAAVNGPTGNLDVVQYLLGAGADVNQILRVGRTGSALAAAASRPTETLEATKCMVTAGAIVDLVLPSGLYATALIAAVCKQDLDTIKYLIASGADVNFLPQSGWYGSALAAASGKGSLEVLRYLVEAGADVNLQLKVGDYGSALATAAGCPFGNGSPWNSNMMIDYLIEAGADPNMLLLAGKYTSALAAAEAESKPMVIQHLRQKQQTIV